MSSFRPQDSLWPARSNDVAETVMKKRKIACCGLDLLFFIAHKRGYQVCFLLSGQGEINNTSAATAAVGWLNTLCIFIQGNACVAVVRVTLLSY